MNMTIHISVCIFMSMSSGAVYLFALIFNNVMTFNLIVCIRRMFHNLFEWCHKKAEFKGFVSLMPNAHEALKIKSSPAQIRSVMAVIQYASNSTQCVHCSFLE